MSAPHRHALAVAAVFAGMLMAVSVLATGELMVRTLTDIGFEGASRNLLTENRFNGRTRGNTPNVTARALGAEVFTDANGFRVPFRGYVYPDPASRRILVIGDSIAFGAGVPEPQSFVGLLRAAHADWAIYNSSVVGYDAANYLDVVADLLSRHLAFSKVILVFCLNDVSGASAANLDTRHAATEISGHRPASAAGVTDGFVEELRSVGLISRVNDYLRDHSKLYVYAKGLATDPSHRYFFADYAKYREPAALSMLDNIGRIATALRQKHIDFIVVMSPYEYQLREDAASPDGIKEDVFLPQRLVSHFLNANGIEFVDASGAFLASGETDKSKLFLRFDPMHFSGSGHKVMYGVINSAAS